MLAVNLLYFFSSKQNFYYVKYCIILRMPVSPKKYILEKDLLLLLTIVKFFIVLFLYIRKDNRCISLFYYIFSRLNLFSLHPIPKIISRLNCVTRQFQR